MAPKNSLVLAALLVVVVVSAGQVPRGAALLGAGTSTNSSFVIAGIVPCATGSSINLATAQPFANAFLHLVCGSSVVDSTTTDSTGAFLFSGSSVTRNLISAILANLCKVVVVTPLSACDKSLAGAAGTLSAQLKLLDIDTGSGSGSDLGGLGGLIGGIAGLIGQIVGGIIGGILKLSTQNFSFV